MKEEYKKISLKLFEDFQSDPYITNQGEKQEMKKFDNERILALNKIKLVLGDFLDGKMTLEDFKSKNDSLNKRNQYWGFKGINGQMFFNMLYKSTTEKRPLENLLLDVLVLPKGIEDAKKKIEIT